MTEPDLAAIKDELRALLEKATPGPWWADVPGFGTIFQDAPTHDERVWLFDVRDGSNADAALIVAAVNALPALLADTPSVEPREDDRLRRAEAHMAHERTRATAKRWREFYPSHPNPAFGRDESKP